MTSSATFPQNVRGSCRQWTRCCESPSVTLSALDSSCWACSACTTQTSWTGWTGQQPVYCNPAAHEPPACILSLRWCGKMDKECNRFLKKRLLLVAQSFLNRVVSRNAAICCNELFFLEQCEMQRAEVCSFKHFMADIFAETREPQPDPTGKWFDPTQRRLLSNREQWENSLKWKGWSWGLSQGRC